MSNIVFLKKMKQDLEAMKVRGDGPVTDMGFESNMMVMGHTRNANVFIENISKFKEALDLVDGVKTVCCDIQPLDTDGDKKVTFSFHT